MASRSASSKSMTQCTPPRSPRCGRSRSPAHSFTRTPGYSGECRSPDRPRTVSGPSPQPAPGAGPVPPQALRPRRPPRPPVPSPPGGERRPAHQPIPGTARKHAATPLGMGPLPSLSGALDRARCGGLRPLGPRLRLRRAPVELRLLLHSFPDPGQHRLMLGVRRHQPMGRIRGMPGAGRDGSRTRGGGGQYRGFLDRGARVAPGAASSPQCSMAYRSRGCPARLASRDQPKSQRTQLVVATC